MQERRVCQGRAVHWCKTVQKNMRLKRAGTQKVLSVPAGLANAPGRGHVLDGQASGIEEALFRGQKRILATGDQDFGDLCAPGQVPGNKTPLHRSCRRCEPGAFMFGSSKFSVDSSQKEGSPKGRDSRKHSVPRFLSASHAQRRRTGSSLLSHFNCCNQSPG